MADGTTKAIKDIQVGGYVWATDPETGAAGPREVITTLPHGDRLLVLRTSSGDVLTTEDHRYSNATDEEWQEGQHLDEGDRLYTASGRLVQVVGVDWAVAMNRRPTHTVDDRRYDDLDAGEQEAMRARWPAEIAARRGRLDLGALFEAQRRPYATLSGEGTVVVHHGEALGSSAS